MARDTVSTERPGSLSTRLAGWRLDAVVSVLSVLMVTGVALDFRRHAQGISFAEEGFFTPEHVLFYSMFLCIGAVIGAAAFGFAGVADLIAYWQPPTPVNLRAVARSVSSFRPRSGCRTSRSWNSMSASRGRPTSGPAQSALLR